MTSNKEPRIILWDIETAHNLAAVFRLWGEDYIPPGNIVQERYIICASWKVLGEEKTHSVSLLDNPKLFKKDPHNDLHVLQVLHKVLAEADCLIAHNGDKYDLKFTEARMLIQGLSPLPPIKTMDTLKIAKKRFLFNSNKLDYLGTILGVGAKIKTSSGLWLEVLKGNKAAIKEMVEYNIEDVNLLERVFFKLRPYTSNHINRNLFAGEGEERACPRCGSTHCQSRGVSRTATRTYQRFQCQDCKGWFSSPKSIDSVKDTKVI